MNDRLVILAGGISSRMRKPAVHGALEKGLEEEADRKAKAMIGVGEQGRPLMDYLLFNAREAGYRDILVVTGEKDSSIRAHYGSLDKGNEYHGLRLSYAVQRIPDGRTKPLGTADALLQALVARPDWAGSRFTVCNSDNIYSASALAALRILHPTGGMIGYDRSALQFSRSRIEQFAVIRKDQDGYLVDVIEKPTSEEVLSLTDTEGRVWVSMNVWRLSYDTMMPYLELLPPHPVRLEKELPAAIRLMIRDHPREIRVIPFAEAVPDLTSKDDIAGVQEYLRRNFRPNLWDEEARQRQDAGSAGDQDSGVEPLEVAAAGPPASVASPTRPEAEVPVHVAARTGPASLREQMEESLAGYPGVMTLAFADGTPVPPALATWATCRWNERSLVVLFEGRFRELRYAPAGTPREPETGKTLKLWDLSDVFEFFVVPDGNTRSVYREFQVSPDSRWFDAAISGTGSARHTDTGWDSHVKVDCIVRAEPERIWKAAMEIPWESLGIVPHVGLGLVANCYRATGKFHGDELLAWSPTGYGDRAFHRTGRYGLVRLG